MHRLLPLLAATVALSAGLSCPTAPFNDLNGNVVQDCVNGNHHLSCANDTQVTIQADGLTSLFDDVVLIDGDWFGLSCSGSVAVLQSNPTVSCPEPVCDHECSFTNTGGVGTKSECIEGNLVKSCADGNLIVGTKEFSKAACISAGRWVAWDCDGRVKQIDGTLEASCSSSQSTCPELLLFDGTEELLAARPLLELVPTLPKMNPSTGRLELACPSILCYATSPTQMVCNEGQLSCESDGWWFKNTTTEQALTLPSMKFGCFKETELATCPGVYFLEGYAVDASGFTVDITQRFSVVDKTQQIKCSSDWQFAYKVQINSELQFADWWLTCSGAASGGWRVRDAGGKNDDYDGMAVGCVRPKTCPALRYLTQADVPATSVGVTVDTTQKLVIVDGVYQLKCSPGSQFAYISVNLGFSTFDWWITCSAAAGDGWTIYEAAGLRGPLGVVPVGCITMDATATPPPPPTTPAPTVPPTTWAPSVPTGELVQLQSSNYRCDFDEKCSFRYYSSQKDMLVNFCDSDTYATNYLKDIRCKNGVTKLEGVSQPADHAYYQCSKAVGKDAYWIAFNGAGAYLGKVNFPVNPIVICSG